MFASKIRDRSYLTPEGKRFFAKTFGVSINQFCDTTGLACLYSKLFPTLDMFKLDDWLFEKHPEHVNKLCMEEVIDKEYGKKATEFVRFWCGIDQIKSKKGGE